jgi:hypothetical protein
MKKYEAVGIGVAVGVLYGSILWFIRQQITWIYNQATTSGSTVLHYYNPDDVAFYTALASVIVAFTIIFLYQKIYDMVEAFAIKNRRLIIDTGEDDVDDEFYNGEEDRV